MRWNIPSADLVLFLFERSGRMGKVLIWFVIIISTDEFANVALPDDFCSLLSTMRSREISSIIIIQNFAQLKALFKDTWETIPGNCDTFIYLGGNEQSTGNSYTDFTKYQYIPYRSCQESGASRLLPQKMQFKTKACSNGCRFP